MQKANTNPCLFNRLGLLALLLCLPAPPAQAQSGQTATWAGGNISNSWYTAANWSPPVVPVNNANTNFTVIVPDSVSLTYSNGGAGKIDALSLGRWSTLALRAANSLEVNGPTVISGLIDAQGPGTAFRALSLNSSFQKSPRFMAADGAVINSGASAYVWEYPGYGYWGMPLLSANGFGSRIDFTNLTSLQVSYQDWGAFTYTIDAKSNGVINLPSLGQITGPGQDEYLDFNIESGGSLLLPKLKKLNGNAHLNVRVPSYELPALEQLTSSGIYVATNNTLKMPAATILDGVAITLDTNATLLATNLSSLRNSDLSVQAGRTVKLGTLDDLYSSRVWVSGGMTLKANALTYDTPDNWRWSPTLFMADGLGSLLDLSLMQTLRVRYGCCGSYTFSMTATNGGVIDFSGLQSMVGPEETDDWLAFNLNNNGNIRLTSLAQAARRIQFNVNVPQYQLPVLAVASNVTFNVGTGNRLDLPAAAAFQASTFNLGDGARVELPQMVSLKGSGFSWGFNSVVDAPNLVDFATSELALAPGRVFNGRPFTNLFGSRLSVSGGTTLKVGALTYDTPQGGDWCWSPTLFSAEGLGSLLDLSTLQTMQARYGWCGSYTYSVNANNGGVIDLSGLDTLIGPGDDDWLVLTMNNDGQILLPTLEDVENRVQFNINVPLYELPALVTATNVTFNVGAGSRLDLPALASGNSCSITLGAGARVEMPNATSLAGSSFTWGINGTINAPNVTDFASGAVDLAPGRAFNTGAFTNIFAARLTVSGGTVLHVAATNYETPANWRWSPTLFAADGAGSLLDLSMLKTMYVHYGCCGSYTYAMNANNGGVLDFSALDRITGPEENDDWLAFSANNGGVIKWGNVVATQQISITLNGLGSKLQAASLRLRQGANLSATFQAEVEVKGDFIQEHTDPNTIVIENAYLRMDGAAPQQLEVAGEDLGPTGSASRNFGASQLIVGNSNQTSLVRLVDTFDNGNRGASGAPEALYLYGYENRGLRLLAGSKFILDGFKCYAWVNGSMVDLSTLIPAGANCVMFDGGYIATTAGPAITNMTPSTRLVPPVDHVDVTFDIPIAPASFTTADVTITGPAGSVTPSKVAVASGNTWRISFPAQTLDGKYDVAVGPNITDTTGVLAGMDQDGDGLAGEAGSDVFRGQFTLDSTGPQISGAFVLSNSKLLGVQFDEAVDPAWATNVGNYLVNGFTPAQAVQPANPTRVVLTVTALVGDSFALEVTGVKDDLGNVALSRSFTGAILALQPVDLGWPGSDPCVQGTAITFNGTDFLVTAGGSDFSGAEDQGAFIYEARTGDFDVRVRVEGWTNANTYSCAGLMVRDGLLQYNRTLITYIRNDNRWYDFYRQNWSWGYDWWRPNTAADNNVPYPNAWMRIQRQGNVFSTYRSTNGIDWGTPAQGTFTNPPTVYVGLGVSAWDNNCGHAATVKFRDFADLTPVIVSNPTNQSVASGQNVAFGVNARGLPPLHYQWFFNGGAISGSDTNLLILNSVTTAKAGDYRVAISSSFGSVTSTLAFLSVDGVGGLAGFEGDVVPRPLGNNAVTVSDWVAVGRFVAGLDEVLNAGEFARNDCAPRVNDADGSLLLGDGRLTVADWTQAGRYAAGLDPLTPVGGPTTPKPLGITPAGLQPQGLVDSGRRVIRAGSVTVRAGRAFELPVELVAEGTENALGFSLNFDPKLLSFAGAALDAAAGSAYAQINDRRAALGQVGFVLAKPAGETFAAGTAGLFRVRFVAAGVSGVAALSFGDVPVVREVASAAAEVQPAGYCSGTVRVMGTGALAMDMNAGKCSLLLSGEPGMTYRLQASSDLMTWTDLSTHTLADGILTLDQPEGTAFGRRFYRLVPQR